MYILGISCFYHDSAAALIKDGQIVAAAQEERFTRIKHDPSFPISAVTYCLKEAGVHLSEIEHVVFYDKPFLKFERLLETYLSFAPRGFKSFKKALPVWIREKLFCKDLITKELKSLDEKFDWKNKVLFTEHHLSHAASAFYPSPFKRAAVLTMDGVGEWVTASVALGDGKDLKIVKEIHFPHSLGLLYSSFTYYIGFKVNSGEYKLMGLAPYGKPVYVELIKEHLIDVKLDGSFCLDLSYFDYCTGIRMINDKFRNLFGRRERVSESEAIEQFHMDIAASIQSVTEEVMLLMCRSIAREYGYKNLCLAGGVALNCVANGKILRDSCFENIWIQPAAGDAGGALGAALAAHHLFEKQERIVTEHEDSMMGAYLGPEFLDHEIEKDLQENGAIYKKYSESEIISKTSIELEAGAAIGWMNSRMEFGPRALGNRSIIGDPRSEKMQRILNLKVKYRESFRPFAPSVLSEDVGEWFDMKGVSPYMLLVADVHQSKQKKMTQEQEELFGIDKLNISRSAIPAVTHVDYSARIQTVHEKTNPRYYKLISDFKKRTGCPVLINTSFNIRGEPIVCTPEDAYRCFMGTELDYLVIGDYFLSKSEQPETLNKNYKDQFKLD